MLLDMKRENQEQYMLALEMYMDYAFDGTEPDLSGQSLVMKLFWKAAKPLIDANNKNYINGCKGGAPAGNQNAKKQPKNNPKSTEKQPKSTQKQGNVNVNDNVNVNANDNENVNANDNVNVNVNVKEKKEICPYVDDKGLITDWDKFHEWKRLHPDWKGADD